MIGAFFDSIKGMPNRSARFRRFSSSESIAVTVGGGVGGLVTSCLGSMNAGGGKVTGWSTFQSTLSEKGWRKREKNRNERKFKYSSGGANKSSCGG